VIEEVDPGATALGSVLCYRAHRCQSDLTL